MEKQIQLSNQVIKTMWLLLFMVCISANGAHSQQLLVDLATQQAGISQDGIDSSKKLKKVIYLDGGEKMLGEVLENIAEQANLKLSYSEELIPMSKEIFVEPGKATVEDALWSVLEGTSLRFGISEAGQLFFFERGEENKSSNQLEQAISGTVIDSQTKEALPGVNVVAKDAGEAGSAPIGTTTDMDGQYELEVPDDVTILVFSYVGYQRLEVPIDGRKEINIELNQDVQMLEDIVVVGYGVQERISQTNSVAQIEGEEFARRPISDARQSLQGFAPGVTVLDQGGAPGSNDIHIRVRGITTLGESSSPLIIVDGIEQGINNINPQDIENISVLKDASSTAIYGSRGANGVILITTKRGKAEKLNVSYNGYYAIQDAINRPEHVGLEEYFRMENAAYLNSGQNARYTDEYIQNYVSNAPSPEYPLPFPWFRRDELGILKAAPQQNHSISVSGGSESIRALASIRYQDVEGLVSNFSHNLNEIRINTDAKLSSRIRISGDVNFRQRKYTEPGDGETAVFDAMLHRSKFAWPQHSTGEYGVAGQGDNPLVDANLSGKNRTTNMNFVGSIKGEFDILPSLTFSTQYAMRYVDVRNKQFLDRYYNQDPITGRVMQRQINSLNEVRIDNVEYTLNSLLTYKQDFNKHGVTGLLGYSTIDHQNQEITGYRENFYNNDVQALGQGSNDNRNATGFDSEYALRSFFSRINYNFDNRYLAEVNARYDGSSRFNKSNRYGFFPSFSLGWVLSEEKFWDGLGAVGTFVNEFKLRASWGQTGNQAIGLYSFYETLANVDYSFNDEAVIALAQSRLANQDLTWEKTKQTDIGIDMGIMQNKLMLSFDYYDKVTDDILLNLPIPGVVGLDPAAQNAGVVENKGYEVSLTYRGGDELSYSINANFSDNRNKVKDLAGAGPFINNGSDLNNPTTIVKEGLPINSHWGYLTDGLFRSQEEVDNYPTLNNNTAPGDIKYVDLNGDGEISPEDWAYLGQSFPRYDYGMTINLMYKNFELFSQWQGAAGHKIRLTGGLQQIVTFETFTHAMYEDYWTPENPDARWPRPIKYDRRNDETSELRMIDGKYLRLKNLVLSYNIPIGITEKFSLNNARVYIGATNLLTVFSELKRDWGLDPETPTSRATYYPQVRQYTIGVDLRF